MTAIRRKWGGSFAARLVRLTLATHGDRCHLCGLPGATTADHLIPRSLGGADRLENLRPAHGKCNRRRQNMPLDVWFASNPIKDPVAAAPPSRQW